MVADLKTQKGSGLSFLSNPITIDINEWALDNVGMIAVAKIIPGKMKATIIATEKADVASPEAIKFAKENDAMILVGISEGEINAIN
ncbi:MAG: hypothetical protein K6F37_04370 [Lachnospiraceae bacterium]|nr:hypothetical protein [Lachnospiraceae bacterium]